MSSLQASSKRITPLTTDFLNIAHRGASAFAPENTFAAFDKALEIGVKDVELDVHYSGDGEIIVIHDATLDRTTNAFGAVADRTLAELRELDAGSWFAPEYAGERIRTLDEVLERYKGRLHLHVEIKAHAPGLASRTADVVRAHDMSPDVTITSFCRPWLGEVRAYAPELATGWLVPLGPDGWDDAIVAQAQELCLEQVCPRANITTPELVRELHCLGFTVRCHGVSSENLMRHVVECGADGMTIDFPDKLIEYLNQRVA